MFAFAIYDLRSKRVFFARDRAGEKPLFYLHENGVLWFGSELKSVLASGLVRRDLNRQALKYYLSIGYVPGNLCLLDGFAKLPPAHVMTYDIEKNTLDVKRYWRLPEPTRDAKESIEDLTGRLEELLKDAVRRQLVADVPVGIMLSGGVDSSLVTAMAATGSSNVIRTFTVTFPAFGTYDEGPHARAVAEYFGTQHTELEAEAVRPEILFELAHQYDEPIADSSMIPTYMLSKLIRRHATVALGGDGGDELFGGYLHYSMILKTARRQKLFPSSFRKFMLPAVQKLFPPGFPYRGRMLAFLAAHPHDAIRMDPYFDAATLERVLAKEMGYRLPEGTRGDFNSGDSTETPYSPLEQATRSDFQNYLSDDILVKVDRASMLASLEVRAPFLDRRIIEFAFGRVPDRFKATDVERKILLKSIAKKVLPKNLNINRKQGFSIPLGDWFHSAWGGFMRNILFDDAQVLFNKKPIRTLMSLQERGIFNYQRLYALTMLELWRREYRVSIR